MPPWVLAKQSVYWMYLALACERIDQRAQEIADKIAEARRKQGDDEEEEDEADSE